MSNEYNLLNLHQNRVVSFNTSILFNECCISFVNFEIYSQLKVFIVVLTKCKFNSNRSSKLDFVIHDLDCRHAWSNFNYRNIVKSKNTNISIIKILQFEVSKL